MRDARRRMRPGDDRRLAALQRDAAIARIGRVRRWMIVATAAMTAGVAALVSAIAPGRSSGAVNQAYSSVHVAASGSSSGSALQMPAPAGAGALGLQGPAQAPQSAPAPDSSSQQAPTPAPAPAPSGGAVSGGS